MSDATNLSINQRVRLVREALHITQREFSTLLSLSGGYIGGVEANLREVNGRLIKLIVSEFSVSEEWLTKGTGEMFIPDTDEKFAKLLSLFKELPGKYQDVVLKMIDILRQAESADAT
jgi:transcriptional regulator with XRE-family HTH domain